MSSGAILIGVAALVMLVAYVLQPFRRSTQDVDALIEHWVADARKGEGQVEKPPRRPQVAEVRDVAVAARDEPIQNTRAAFCHNCGKPVGPDHHFCRNCGTRLDVG